MPIKKQINTKKQTTARSNVKSSSVLKTKSRFNKKVALLLTVLIAGIGVYFIFFANAESNNCQEDSGVNICDVDMVGGDTDTMLSITGQAQSLGAKGWGVYYGADFRAPTAPFKGAVPVTQINNTKYTWHDWVTTSQKSQKEAKDGTKINEGIAFYAWEKPGVAGTVPVYRLTRGGPHSQSIFSTDKAWVDKILAQDASNPDGWKSGTVLPLIAFYAYPPGYAVANTVNPYDCSIQVNFLSDRCKMQREALVSSQTPTTNTPAKTPTTTPAKTPTTTNTTSGSGSGSGTTNTSNKPISNAPAPPQSPVKFAECPKTIQGYQDAVNVQKLNLDKNCHIWWWTTAQQQTDQYNFYKAIQDCENRKPTPGYFYDYKCNDMSKENAVALAAWLAGIEAARVSCIGQAGSQTFNPNNFECIQNNPQAPTKTPTQPPAKPSGGKQPIGIEISPKNLWDCTVRGEFSLPKRGWTELQLTKDIAAVNKATANRLCDEWKSSLNRQDKYRGFYSIGVRPL